MNKFLVPPKIYFCPPVTLSWRRACSTVKTWLSFHFKSYAIEYNKYWIFFNSSVKCRVLKRAPSPITGPAQAVFGEGAKEQEKRVAEGKISHWN